MLGQSQERSFNSISLANDVGCNQQAGLAGSASASRRFLILRQRSSSTIGARSARGLAPLRAILPDRRGSVASDKARCGRRAWPCKGLRWARALSKHCAD
jgi:hypothetical protein